MASRQAELLDLPDEILEHAFSFLPPQEPQALPACLLVSKRLYSVAQHTRLWTPLFARWSDAARSLASPAQIGGPAHYALRMRKDNEAMRLIRELACTTHKRGERIAKLVELGLDVTDRLEEAAQMEEDASPEDWISLRYWAGTTLGIVRRATALETWARIRDEEDGLESLLDGVAAFSVYMGDSASHVRTLLPIRQRRRSPVQYTELLAGFLEQASLFDPAFLNGDHDTGRHLRSASAKIWSVVEVFARQTQSILNSKIIFKHAQQGCPYGLPMLARHFLPLCDEEARADALRICAQALANDEVEPEVKVWDVGDLGDLSTPREYGVAEVIVSLTNETMAILSSWEVEDEVYSDGDDGNSSSSISYVRYYYVLKSDGTVIELSNADIRYSAGAQDFVLFMRGAEVGLSFRSMKGGQLVPSVYMDAVYPPPQRPVTRY